MKRMKRFEVLEKRPINRDGYSDEWPEVGLIAMNSPYDPEPSLRVEDGRVVEMDGRSCDDFDTIDSFIVKHVLDLEHSEEYMATEEEELARMLVDINVPREKILEMATAITPAKLTRVVEKLNMVEIMMCQMKMRARKKPANQAHVTNVNDNPALMAADAAEAALRGFAELETTTAVSRLAPFNAIALLVGGASCRKGTLSQCSLEEAMELQLGMKGFTSYAETISVYGTDAVFTDGDDTPWSKGILASIYASRGMKIRFTSGTGSEVLMGSAEKKSMLYLEARCLYLTRACGAQGTQNGSVSCIGIPAAVPQGFRAIAAENLMASILGLEVASGNDQTFTHSDMRRMSKLFPQFVAGTDFITSGFSAIPNSDDMFAGSNMDCDDYDDWYVLQRDMNVDGGIYPVDEEEVIRARLQGAKAMQAVFRELELPEISDEEVQAATYAYSSEDMPPRKIAEDLKAIEQINSENINGIDVMKALHSSGFEETAENLMFMLEQRISGDYLQTAAIFDEDGNVRSSLNDENQYMGPGSGYIIAPGLWKRIMDKEGCLEPQAIE